MPEVQSVTMYSTFFSPLNTLSSTLRIAVQARMRKVPCGVPTLLCEAVSGRLRIAVQTGEISSALLAVEKLDIVARPQ
jgi:hypothetical protein